jgi:hypothetical protein
MIMLKRSMIVVAFLAFSLSASVVFAQCACSAAPVATATYAPTTTYYAPEAYTYTSNYAPTTAYYAPETYTSYYVPTTTYYAPETYTSYYAPTTAYYAPTTAYYPSVYTSYYAPTTAYYSPYVAYAPVAGAAVVASPYTRVGASVYGTPKVYVRGEPVRNAWRAITP